MKQEGKIRNEVVIVREFRYLSNKVSRQLGDETAVLKKIKKM